MQSALINNLQLSQQIAGLVVGKNCVLSLMMLINLLRAQSLGNIRPVFCKYQMISKVLQQTFVLLFILCRKSKQKILQAQKILSDFTLSNSFDVKHSFRIWQRELSTCYPCSSNSCTSNPTSIETNSSFIKTFRFSFLDSLQISTIRQKRVKQLVITLQLRLFSLVDCSIKIRTIYFNATCYFNCCFFRIEYLRACKKTSSILAAKLLPAIYKLESAETLLLKMVTSVAERGDLGLHLLSSG